jgi:hypothetical protein
VTFEGFEVIGVPAAVKKAVAEAAGLFFEGVEFFSNEAGMETVAEKIDVIAITYRTRQAGEKKEATKFEALNRILRGLYKADTGSGGLGIARVERV